MYGRGDNDRDPRFPQAVRVAHFMFVVTLAIAFGVAGKDHTQWLEKKIPKVLAMSHQGEECGLPLRSLLLARSQTNMQNSAALAVR